METNKRPEPGKIYRHFKNKLYQIITVAVHSETGEELVIYQALYGDFKVYARPLSMFTSIVDKNKYPSVTQKYRFELTTPNTEGKQPANKDSNFESSESSGSNGNNENLESNGIHAELIDFLDACSYEEKLRIFLSMKKSIDERTLRDISVSLDLVLNEGTLKEQYESIRNCLETYCKFENKRFR